MYDLPERHSCFAQKTEILIVKILMLMPNTAHKYPLFDNLVLNPIKYWRGVGIQPPPLVEFTNLI